MKSRLLTGAAMILFAAGVMLAAEGSWTGYISDSHCGAKGAKEGHADCATKCVKDADKKVYAIDAQDQVAAHAGHHVTVKGTIEGDSLKLSGIEMAAK